MGSIKPGPRQLCDLLRKFWSVGGPVPSGCIGFSGGYAMSLLKSGHSHLKSVFRSGERAAGISAPRR